MIVVTGASGAVGRRVAERLTARGERIRLFARDASRVPDIPGAEVATGSYEDPASLDAAMRGASTVFVVSAGGEPVKRSRLHANAIDAAARAGASHVVYLSFQGASSESRFPYGVDHALSEKHLRLAGVPFTVLRDSLYLDIIPHLFGADGVVRGPAGDGRTAWVARDDVADVAAAVLANPAPHAGAVLDVTGPEATTYGEVAAQLSELTGRALRYENETIAEAKRSRAAFGAPDWEVDVWLGSYAAAAAGELAGVSDTVERLAGHPPLDLRAFAARYPEWLAPLRG
jgi:uncharacterized protein YbjT (DUF2867 family)